MDICLLAPFLCSFPQQLVFPNVIINIYFAFFNIETLCVCVGVAGREGVHQCLNR